MAAVGAEAEAVAGEDASAGVAVGGETAVATSPSELTEGSSPKSSWVASSAKSKSAEAPEAPADSVDVLAGVEDPSEPPGAASVVTASNIFAIF